MPLKDQKPKDQPTETIANWQLGRAQKTLPVLLRRGCKTSLARVVVVLHTGVVVHHVAQVVKDV